MKLSPRQTMGAKRLARYTQPLSSIAEYVARATTDAELQDALHTLAFSLSGIAEAAEKLQRCCLQDDIAERRVEDPDPEC